MKKALHLHKYKNFKKEAKRANYVPSKIENYFLSAFHLIEAFVFERAGIHIQKHQKVREKLESNKFIFEDRTEGVWNSFQDLENQVRIATSYGKRDNGELLEKTEKIFQKIESLCELDEI